MVNTTASRLTNLAETLKVCRLNGATVNRTELLTVTFNALSGGAAFRLAVRVAAHCATQPRSRLSGRVLDRRTCRAGRSPHDGGDRETREASGPIRGIPPAGEAPARHAAETGLLRWACHDGCTRKRQATRCALKA